MNYFSETINRGSLQVGDDPFDASKKREMHFIRVNSQYKYMQTHKRARACYVIYVIQREN